MHRPPRDGGRLGAAARALTWPARLNSWAPAFAALALLVATSGLGPRSAAVATRLKANAPDRFRTAVVDLQALPRQALGGPDNPDGADVFTGTSTTTELAIGDVVPGDSWRRGLTLRNTGSVSIQVAGWLEASDTASGALVNGGARSFGLRLSRCPDSTFTACSQELYGDGLGGTAAPSGLSGQALVVIPAAGEAYLLVDLVYPASVADDGSPPSSMAQAATFRFRWQASGLKGDATPPVLALAASPALARAGSSVQFVLTGDEPLQAVPSVTISGACISPASLAMQPGVDARSWSGAYVVPSGTDSCVATATGRATDLAGNAGQPATASLTIDRTPPSASVLLSGGTTGLNGWWTASPTFTVAATDADSGIASVEYQAVNLDVNPTGTPDAAAWHAYTSPFTLPDGRWYVYARAADRAGNGSPQVQSALIPIDTTPPVVTFTSAGPSPAAAGTQVTTRMYSASRVEASDFDPGFPMVYSGPCVPTTQVSSYRSVEGAGYAYYSYYTVPPGVDNCTVTVSATPTDPAGNATSVSGSFLVDRVAPSAPSVAVSGGTPGLAGWYTVSPTYSLAATDDSGLAPTLHYQAVAAGAAAPAPTLPGAWTTYAGPFTLPDGQWDVYAFASDAAGNAGPVQLVASARVDSTPPALAVAVSPSVVALGQTATITVRSSEPLAVAPSVQVSGACLAPTTLAPALQPDGVTYTAAYTVPASAGTCQATADASGASDPAGNPAPAASAAFKVGSDPYAPAVLVDSPIGYWRLNETAGTLANDSSGYGRNGMYAGGVTLGGVGPTTGSLAATFDGVTGRVDLPLPTTAVANVTLEAWVRPSSTQTGDGTFLKVGDPQTGYGMLLQYTAGSQPSRQFVGLYEYVRWLTPGASLSSDAWSHVAMSIDGVGTPRFFVNGALVATLPGSGPLAPAGGAGIGAYNGGGRFFTGAISEVALYGTALDPTRIAAHYQAGRP